MKFHRWKILFTLVLLAFFLPVHAGESQDLVYLKEGGKLRGNIVSESPEKIVLSTPYKTTHTIYREEIRRIERKFTPAQEFNRRLTRLQKNPNPSAEAYYQLGLFAEEHPPLKDRARGLYQKAVALNPDHEGARSRLGHVKVEGRWMTRDEIEKMRKEAREREKERDKERKTETKKVDKKRKRPRWKGEKDDFFAKYHRMLRDNEPAVPWEKAFVVESKYYVIKSNLKKKYIKVYAEILDQFYEIFVKVFRYRRPLRKKFPIWIFNSRKEFIRVTGNKTAAGYYDYKKVVTYHYYWGLDRHTFNTLAHECTHQFQHMVLGMRNMGRTPVWVIEGLAVFLSTVFFDGKKLHIGKVHRSRLRILKRLIKKGKHIPLKELFDTKRRKFTGVHYAHAWGVIYWMVYTSKRNRRIFNMVWEKCKRGGMSLGEFKDIIRVDMDKWEEVWVKWIKNLDPDFKPKIK